MWKADKICGRLKSVAPFKIQINWPAIRRVHLFRYHFLINRGCAIFEKNDKKHARTHYILVKNRLELTRISGIKFILN